MMIDTETSPGNRCILSEITVGRRGRAHAVVHNGSIFHRVDIPQIGPIPSETKDPKGGVFKSALAIGLQTGYGRYILPMSVMI